MKSMVEWVSFGLNVLVPILIGIIILLTVALYVGVREVSRRVPSKEEMMDMGYTVLNTVVDEKAEALGISEMLKPSSQQPNGPPVAGAGRPGEGMLGKLMWFAENTAIGRSLAAKFLGGPPSGGSSSPPDYYG